jgi:hypothetical protein
VLHIRALKEYLNFCNKMYKCTRRKYVLTHIINYQHVVISFAVCYVNCTFSTLFLEPETKKCKKENKFMF